MHCDYVYNNIICTNRELKKKFTVRKRCGKINGPIWQWCRSDKIKLMTVLFGLSSKTIKRKMFDKSEN